MKTVLDRLAALDRRVLGPRRPAPPPGRRTALALIASGVAWCVAVLVLLARGVDAAAVFIAGGVLLVLIGLESLRASRR